MNTENKKQSTNLNLLKTKILNKYKDVALTLMGHCSLLAGGCLNFSMNCLVLRQKKTCAFINIQFTCICKTKLCIDLIGDTYCVHLKMNEHPEV